MIKVLNVMILSTVCGQLPLFDEPPLTPDSYRTAMLHSNLGQFLEMPSPIVSSHATKTCHSTRVLTSNENLQRLKEKEI